MLPHDTAHYFSLARYLLLLRQPLEQHIYKSHINTTVTNKNMFVGKSSHFMMRIIL